MKLTRKAKECLKGERVKTLISLEIGVCLKTFYKWIRDEHDNLTWKKTIDAIVKHTGLKESEIFEKK